MSDEIKISYGSIKKGISYITENKKISWVIFIILLLSLIIFSSWIRLQNIELLKDVTTGGYIPIELDTFYFLRIAQTTLEHGSLPEYDPMRQPHNITYANEILPQVLLFMHKIWKLFDPSVTLEYVDIIYPVIFFALGLFIFFFLIYTLTKSKLISLLSSIFLAFIPTYLYRTVAGFADHEAIGMVSFFSTLLLYGIFLNYLEDDNKRNLKKTIIFSLILGFFSALTSASWGGISNFLFMIIPLSFLLIWMIKSQNYNKNEMLNYFVFYIVFIFSAIISPSIYGYSIKEVILRLFVNSTNVLTGAALLFIIVDFFVLLKKDILNEKLKKYRIFISLLFTIFIAIILAFLVIPDINSFISQIIDRLLHPFGTDRISLTVAENQQPYLNDWISQIGRSFFWLFYFGLIIFGVNISRGIDKKMNRWIFLLLWIFMISGLLLSRISAASILNGTNFISQTFYFISIFVFFFYFTFLYLKNRVKIKNIDLLLFAWLFFFLIAARGAVRLFFVISPFVSFIAVYATINLYEYSRKSKDEVIKVILIALTILAIIFLFTTFRIYYLSTVNQAKFAGPTVTPQWMKAMEWVRGNTNERDIFAHWWDYGYWVQSLGERPTISDGGHFQGAFRDHMIGRYLLTTPEPDIALSFMKTNNVSYLLIDSTDIGKYSAYSKIGSDESGEDRFSSIPILTYNPAEVTESINSTIRLYRGAGMVEDDIVYSNGTNEIFIPANNAFFGGFILETSGQGSNVEKTAQPMGVFIYNNQQYNIPLRYIYYNNKILDFKNGVDGLIYLIPSVAQNAQGGVNIDNVGAAIYLSPRNMKSLVAQIYLLDDVFDNYQTLKLAYSQDDQVVEILKGQGAQIDEFVFFQGLRGPIKIWKVDYSNDVLVKEEFLRTAGEYAEFDNLTFRK